SNTAEPDPSMRRPAASSTADGVTRVAADLPPLPPGVDMAARPAQVVRLAYEFAGRHPEVLEYVPCFCGCERGGHRANHDCFVARRGADGAVAEWSSHGLNCEICLDVADLARRMHEAGADVPAIRAEVERQFASAPGHTPTPMPPTAGA